MVAVCALMLTACSDDDNNPTPPDDGDTPKTTTGVYVISQGNIYSSIDGALTYYNPLNSDNTTRIFAAANGRALKGTPNNGLVYGSKLYIACTDENLIEVADAKTAKSIKQIPLQGARRIIADGGYLYATSFFDNVVAKIDTAELAVVQTVETGTYP